jgi:Carboxypeptidase regulatory-like domain
MNRFAYTLRVLPLVLAIAGVLTLGVSLAYGQAITGNIVGTVEDSSGAAVVNADVSSVNVATGVTAAGKTNGTGQYRFDNLLSGNYRVTVKSAGFRTTTIAVEVRLNTTSTANVKLEPGASTETVEVSGEAPIIDTTTIQLGNTFEGKELRDVAIANLGVATNGQNLGVINLSLLDAGVGSTGGLGAGTGPSISGQRPRNNNFTVEGIDNNDKGVTGPLIYVPAEAVSNFTLLQNQFSPEFGHSTGGQFNVTVLGGTNAFHGAVYEYFQNRNLNAVDYDLSNQGILTNPRYDNNRYGGQVGGPIFKNKLFFFANFEYNAVGLASTPGSPVLAPTQAGYTTLSGIPGASANNISILQQYAVAPSACPPTSPACPTGGTVSVGGTPVQVGILPIVAPNYTNYRALTTSMDYNISDRDQLRGRYIYNKLATIDTGAQLPVFYTPFVQPFHLVNLSEYHTFSPSITNELRVGYHRTGQNFTVPNFSFPGLDEFPNITVDDLGQLNVGPDGNAPQYAVQNLYQLVDNVTWTKGNHTLKFGIEGNKAISPQLFIQRSRGDYDWSTLESYVLDQVPDFGQRSFGAVGYSGDQYGIFWYVNDIWKIRPNFSVNLGLRYEYTSTPFGWSQMALNSVADLPGVINFTAPQAPKRDYMPRVGFAWSPGSSGNTSIRGGFGMGYDVLYDNIGVLSRPPQIGSTKNCPDPVCQDPFLANGGIPPQASSGITILDQADARDQTSAFLPNKVKYPYSEQWNLGVQHVFKRDYTAEVRYVGTRGVDLDAQNIIDFQPVTTPSHHLPTYLQNPGQATLDALPLTLGTMLGEFNAGGFFLPQFLNNGFDSPITGFLPLGASTYHGLQTQLNRRFSNGLQFQAAYTFSHMIDNGTADFFSTVIAPRRPQDFLNLPAERSNSLLDHRHRFTLSTIYDMPFFSKSSSWLERNLLGNYEFGAIYTWESGQWGTAQSGVDSNLNADSAPDRPIYNASGTPGVGSGVMNLCNSSLPAGHLCNHDPDTSFDPSPYVVAYQAINGNAQYIVAGKGALSDTARSTISTPPINNWDMTLGKHIAITERVRFDITAGLLNAFNHPQFVTGSPNQALSFSVTGAQRNYLIPSQPNFENARASFPSNARQMVIGIKLVF